MKKSREYLGYSDWKGLLDAQESEWKWDSPRGMSLWNFTGNKEKILLEKTGHIAGIRSASDFSTAACKTRSQWSRAFKTEEKNIPNLEFYVQLLYQSSRKVE